MKGDYRHRRSATAISLRAKNIGEIRQRLEVRRIRLPGSGSFGHLGSVTWDQDLLVNDLDLKKDADPAQDAKNVGEIRPRSIALFAPLRRRPSVPFAVTVIARASRSVKQEFRKWSSVRLRKLCESVEMT